MLGAGLGEVLAGTPLIVGPFTRAFAGVALALFALTLFGLPDDPVLTHVSPLGLGSTLMLPEIGRAHF